MPDEYGPSLVGIVADEADQEVTFHPTFGHSMMISSVSSLMENGANAVDPFDFSVYMDRVRFPCVYSFKELVH